MAEEGKPTVQEYMTREVATVSPDDTVRDVAERIAASDDHSGFPVCEGRHVEVDQVQVLGPLNRGWQGITHAFGPDGFITEQQAAGGDG